MARHPKTRYIPGLPGQRCRECPRVKNHADPGKPKYYCLRGGRLVKVHADGTCRERILETAPEQADLIALASTLGLAARICHAGWVMRVEGDPDGWMVQFGGLHNPLFRAATPDKALAKAVRWAWAQQYGEAA